MPDNDCSRVNPLEWMCRWRLLMTDDDDEALDVLASI